jgi:hypothetical protein
VLNLSLTFPLYYNKPIIKEVNVDHPSWEFLCDSKDSLSHAILEMEYPHEIEINIQ